MGVRNELQAEYVTKHPPPKQKKKLVSPKRVYGFELRKSGRIHDDLNFAKILGMARHGGQNVATPLESLVKRAMWIPIDCTLPLICNSLGMESGTWSDTYSGTYQVPYQVPRQSFAKQTRSLHTLAGGANPVTAWFQHATDSPQGVTPGARLRP